jgi:WD40 repeat protein
LTANGPGGRAVAFSADGKTLAVGGDQRITLWDVDRQAVIASLDGAD